MMQLTPGVAWFVSAVLIEAAVIDGWQRRVPNWLTFHLAIGGLIYSALVGGLVGLMWALAGLALGLALLMPLHVIGGMGTGDVKLLACVGAWMGPAVTLGAFVATALIGGVIAVAMILRSGDYVRHIALAHTIVHEILTVRDPVKLSEMAAARKPTMMLLPYGIPIAIGSIGYFAWLGLFA